jgi:hypothetical protein
MRVRFPSPARRKFHPMILFRFTVHSIAVYRSSRQHYSVLSQLTRIFKLTYARAEGRLEPHSSTPKCGPPQGWSCGLDFLSPAPLGLHLIDVFQVGGRTIDTSDASTGRQRCLSRISDPVTLARRTSWRPVVLPDSEGPRGRPRRTRNAGRPRRRSATAASDKAADGPLPACRHLQHRKPVVRSRRGTGAARRQGGRQAAGGPDLSGRERHRGQRPQTAAR